MKLLFLWSVLLFAFTSMLTGCGARNSDPKSVNSSGYDQATPNNCSDQFISDFNSINSIIRTMVNAVANSVTLTQGNLKGAATVINEFSNNYNGVVCRATFAPGNGSNSVRVMVNADQQVAVWSKVLTGLARQNSSQQNNPAQNQNPNNAVSI